MRKRYRIKNKIRFSVFIGLLCVLIFSLIYVNVNAADSPQIKHIRVKEGDTLWSIAEENYNYKNHDIRQYIYEIRQINGLETANLQINDELKLPY